MKIIFAVLTFLAAAFVAADTIPLTVGLKYRNLVEETKFVDGKVTEKVIKDYGYSELNQQMLDLLRTKLKKKNYAVVDGAAYSVVIDPVIAVSGPSVSYSIFLEVYRDASLVDEHLIAGYESYASYYPDTASKKILEHLMKVIKG